MELQLCIYVMDNQSKETVFAPLLQRVYETDTSKWELFFKAGICAEFRVWFWDLISV